MAPPSGPDEYGDAVVDFHPSRKLPPSLSEGNITARSVSEFQESYERYFSMRNTPENSRYAQVKYTVFPDKVKLWVHENDATLSALSFAQFIEAMRAEFLQGNWMSSHIRESVRCHMSDVESFKQYTTRVKLANKLLPDNIRLSNASLRESLRAGWNISLNSEWDCIPHERQDAINNIPADNLAEWIKQVRQLDKVTTAKVNQFAKVVEAKLRDRIAVLERLEGKQKSTSSNAMAATVPVAAEPTKRGASANNISNRNKARSKTQSKPAASSLHPTLRGWTGT